MIFKRNIKLGIVIAELTLYLEDHAPTIANIACEWKSSMLNINYDALQLLTTIGSPRTFGRTKKANGRHRIVVQCGKK